MDEYGVRFSLGPWNIHEGADPLLRPYIRKLDVLESDLTLSGDEGIDESN